MNQTEVLSTLKSERDALVTQVRETQDALRRVNGAIDALEGHSPAPSNGERVRGGLDAQDSILGTMREAAADQVWDYKALKGALKQKFPTEAYLLKSVYSTIAVLIKKGKVRKVPGGFILML